MNENENVVFILKSLMHQLENQRNTEIHPSFGAYNEVFHIKHKPQNTNLLIPCHFSLTLMVTDLKVKKNIFGSSQIT